MTEHPVGSGGAEAAERLLAQVGAGDEDAFRALYGRLGPAAYGLALNVLRDPHLAQDAVQEAFVQVWSQATGFDPRRGSARAWVLARVHRRAVDRVRREDAQRRSVAHLAIPREEGHDEVAEVVLIRADHRAVRAALARLTALQQQVVDLAYYQGLTQTQIAEELGVPLGTVKTRMRDALIALRTGWEVDG